MVGQGKGCRSNNSKRGWCEKTIADFCGGKDKEPNPIPASGDTCGGQTAPLPLRAVTIGGQCNASEPLLPPRCRSQFTRACAQIPGMAAICYNATAAEELQCVNATKLAKLVEEGTTCDGFSGICMLY